MVNISYDFQFLKNMINTLNLYDPWLIKWCGLNKSFNKLELCKFHVDFWKFVFFFWRQIGLEALTYELYNTKISWVISENHKHFTLLINSWVVVLWTLGPVKHIMIILLLLLYTLKIGQLNEELYFTKM